MCLSRPAPHSLLSKKPWLYLFKIFRGFRVLIWKLKFCLSSDYFYANPYSSRDKKVYTWYERFKYTVFLMEQRSLNENFNRAVTEITSWIKYDFDNLFRWNFECFSDEFNLRCLNRHDMHFCWQVWRLIKYLLHFLDDFPKQRFGKDSFRN